MQEVELFSERQEVLAALVEDKIVLQSKATEKYHETIFEELRELDEKRSVGTRAEKAHFVTMSK